MTVTFGPTTDAVAVEVPLLRGDGEARPKVTALLDEEHEVVAVLDVAHGPTAIGGILAARLGLEVKRGRVHLRRLRVGDLLLDDVVARVLPGDELTIGLSALPDTATAVLASEGTVRFVRAEQALPLLLSVGAPVPLRQVGRGWAVEGELGGNAGLLAIRTDRPRSAASAALPGEVAPAGVPEVWSWARVGALALPAGWWEADGSVARPATLGLLGADALALVDLAIDPATERIAMAPVAYGRWTDAASQRLAILEDDSTRWPVPVEGEDLLARLRWERLAEGRWRVGDAAGALLADQRLAKVAGERCELHLAIGERALRAGHDAVPALTRAAELYERWVQLEPEVRDRVREGRTVPDGTLAVRQPQACARARVLLDATLGRLDRSEAALRARIGAGERLDPALRLALAALLAAEGRFEPALDWAKRASRVPDPHPLTTALGIAEGLGTNALLAAVEADPGWVAGRVVAEALGHELGVGPELEVLRATRPGDASARCTVALHDGLRAPATVPDRAEADCLAAAILLAHVRGQPEVGAIARATLRARWPELWVDDPGPSVVRIRDQEDP